MIGLNNSICKFISTDIRSYSPSRYSDSRHYLSEHTQNLEKKRKEKLRKQRQKKLELRKRERNYDVKFSKRKNMFGGLPYNQYNSYMRKDEHMQKLIIRDQLLIIIDKISNLKNNVSDKGLIKMVRIIK